MMQGSPEWSQSRCGFVTASAFKFVLAKGRNGGESIGRKNLRARLIAERLSGRPAQTYESDAMSAGKILEGRARTCFEVVTGKVVEEIGFIEHPYTRWIGCSPDGLIAEDGLIEIKSHTEPAIHIETLQRGMPKEHLPQVQGQMWITGRKWVDFVSYSPDMPERHQLHIERIHRSTGYIAYLAAEVKAFLREVDKSMLDLDEPTKIV